MRISDWSSDVCSSDLGGAAGFAKGGARVRLADEGAATLLSYDVDAQVGVKLAQIGSRLIDGTAKKMADDFFSRFTQTVERGEAPAPGEAAPRSEGRRVGKEWVSTCRSRWSPYP